MYSKLLIALSLTFLLASLQGNRQPAWAHAYPAISIPDNGATASEPPREVRIQFTEGVEIALSRIAVKGTNGEVVSRGKLRQLAEDTLAIDLKPMGPGNYTVEWQVLSVDTHITEGVLRFTVAAKGK
jgi:copper resistance protein C